MDLKIKKEFSISMIVTLISIYLIGLPLVYTVIHLIGIDPDFNLSLINLFLANLSLTMNNLGGLIIGMWMFYNAESLKQDKWTWLLIGLIYGQYSLLLIAIIMIMQNINSRLDLINSIRKILVLLIITFFLNIAAKSLLTPYLTYVMDATNYGFVIKYTSLLTIISYGLMILMNIILAIKLSSWIKSIYMPKRIIWIIATLFLRVFPVILFNVLTITQKENY
jgi:hypothetical protein